MRIRENLGGLTALATKNKLPTSLQKAQMGRVAGVITTENTPTKELFEKYGGYSGLGIIFYINYNQSSNIDINNVDLNKCKVAYPFSPNTQKYPLVGEVVQLIDGPSPVSQISSNTGQKYYTEVVNIWNNIQQNAPSTGNLGKTFTESSDIRRLMSFEGDTIYQGRKGNGIRFGSTVKGLSNLNEWSSIGNDGDPITILVNGYVTTPATGSTVNIEEINKEQSSVYLTTTQVLPLQPNVSIINPKTKTLKPKDYSSSQIILNSNRITLNAKQDEVLLFAKSNIELSTDNKVNINAGDTVHINSPFICLGTTTNNDYPTEPVLLGGKTHDFLLDLLNTLTTLAGFLVEATATTSEGAIPITTCNVGGEQLLADIDGLISKLETITSDNVYTT